jgi:hypothetical protein
MVIKVVYTQLVCQNGKAFEDMGREIAEIAAKTNKASGITGILAVDVETGSVIQVIEGPKDKVALVCAKIEKDPRHSIDKVLPVAVVSKPGYKRWSNSEHDIILNELLHGAQMNYAMHIYTI